MTAPTKPVSRLDPLALPIAAKIAIGLGVVLLFSSLFTGSLVRRVVQVAQISVVSNELEALSRSQALRVADTLEREVEALSQLTLNNVVQAQLQVSANQTPEQVLASGATFQRSALMFQQLQPFKLAHPELDVVVLLDVWGHVLAIDPLSFQEDLPAPGGWDWFSGPLNGRGVFITGPQDDHLTTFRGVHIVVPVYDVKSPDRVIGVMYAVWNMNNLPEVIGVHGREGLVVEPDGTVMMTASGERNALLRTSLAEELRQERTGSFQYTEPAGEPWLYGYTHFAALDLQQPSITSINWIVVTREPLAATQATIDLLTRRLMTAIGISAVLITLAIAGFSFMLTRPLYRLTQAADQIRAGDLDAPIPVLPLDEVGNLADVLRELVGRLIERVHHLNAAVRVSRVAVSSLDISPLLDSVAQAVTTEFGYPGVLIYLSDDGMHQARLQAIAGQPHEPLTRGHTVAVNKQTGLGRAILLGEPQLGAEDEAVLPLHAAGRVLGALSVTGERGQPFSQEDIDILSLVADQISSALENARLYEQSAANLAEIEALNRRLTRLAWEGRLEAGGSLRHTRDPEARWPHNLDAVAQRDQVVAETYTDADGRSVLAAPVVLRGESIGTLAVTRPPGVGWTRDERALLEAVASRLAIIAESIRLVEETSWRAEREQRVNEVSANLLQRAASVDGVLQTALNELSGVLGSDHVSLRLGRPPLDSERQIGAGSGQPRPAGNGRGDDANPDPNGGPNDGP